MSSELRRRLKPNLWFTLFEVFLLGAGVRWEKVSTTYLASIIGVSQQSASRHLSVLQQEGMINRRIGSSGSLIRITETGMRAITEVYSALQNGLKENEKEVLNFEGTVFSGMFQGAYYLSQGDYIEQIQEKLGFKPYLGTLNIRIREGDFEQRQRLERMPSIRLQGFRGENREFGGGRCYPLIVNNEVEGALLVADRTSYDISVMEIIAPVNLREKFSLKDGNTVNVTILGPRLSSS
jgi:riboflavin kinase